MLRHPVVITSLEEDFREIGLLDESEVPHETPATPEAPAETPATAPEGGNLDERRIMRQVRVTGGKAKRIRTKRTGAAQRAYGRAYKRRKKAQIKRREARASTQRRAARRDKIRARLKREGTDRVANLLENVQDILAQIQGGEGAAPQEIEVTVEDTVKTFANLAMIAEMLADAFDTFAEQDDLSKFEVAGLSELALRYAQIAEECADLAEKLDKDGLDESDGDIEETFRNCMEAVLDGLDIYSDLTEEEDEEACEKCGKVGEKCECPPVGGMKEKAVKGK